MTSSGMKRGLAAVAVSALAVTGLPALAGTANATPNATVTDADKTEMYNQLVTGGASSTKDDGTNTTVSLVAGGGVNVTSVQFQFLSAVAGSDWVNVGPVQGRNADGVFAYDWAAPAGSAGTLRAVPNTGEANAASGPISVTATADSVELSTEGSLGVFQSPYGGGEDWVIVDGTTSGPGQVTVKDRSHTMVTGTTTATDADGAGAGTTGEFATALNINGYPYSGGSEANQIVLGAAFDTADADAIDTDDAEASTLYQQTITTITAVPEDTFITGGTTPVTVTITDQNGNPIAGARAGYQIESADTGSSFDDEPAGSSTTVGTTDAKGQVTVNLGAGNYRFYADKTTAEGYQAGDPTAAPFQIQTYTPTATSLAISSDKSRTAFDFDELDGNNDFFATLLDQQGNGIAGAEIEYRWSVDATGTANDFTGDWTDVGGTNAGDTDSDGKVAIPFPDSTSLDEPGTYTLEVRRPNDTTTGTGLFVATPKSFEIRESEITWDEGDHANAPVNGSVTLTGNLALVGSGTDLGGRTVTITLDAAGAGENASFAPTSEQPSGTTVTAGVATATTDANGNFSVKLNDPTIPPNVQPTEEHRTVTASADDAQENGLGPVDTVTNDARDAVTVHFIEQPDVDSIDIDVNSLIDGMLTPGRPADLDIIVEDADGNDLQDFPVEVSVDRGFLSNTAGGLTPAAGSDDDGDLYGVWKNDGTTEQISTGDLAEGDVAVAIERDAGFDDDGLVTMTVTVKAGDVTETETITFSSDNPLNSGGLTLDRIGAEGDAVVGQTVEYNVFAKDQFGNLVGNDSVLVLDNTTVAAFTTDGVENRALTDFINDTASITATSSGPVAQTLEGRWSTVENVWDDGARDQNNVQVTDTDTINWVSAKKTIVAELNLSNQKDGDDVAKVNAPAAAAGATVKLFKIKKDGTKVLVAKKTANAKGNAKFVVNDNKPNKSRKFQAKVMATAATFADWTPKRSIK